MPTRIRALTHFDEPRQTVRVVFAGDISTQEDVNYLRAIFSVFHSNGLRTVYYDIHNKGTWNSEGEKAFESCLQRIRAHGGCAEERNLQ